MLSALHCILSRYCIHNGELLGLIAALNPALVGGGGAHLSPGILGSWGAGAGAGAQDQGRTWAEETGSRFLFLEIVWNTGCQLPKWREAGRMEVSAFLQS